MADSISDADKIRNKRLAKLGTQAPAQASENGEGTGKTGGTSRSSPSSNAPSSAGPKEAEQAKPRINISNSMGSSTPQNPFTQLGMKEANGDTPKINITSSTGRPVTPQKRDRPSSSIGRPSSRSGETSEQWEDRILGSVFKFTLDPDYRLDSHENLIHYLGSTRQELEETSQPLRFNTSLLDQTILEAASNLKQGTSPLDYLLGCWKRINRQFKTLKRAGEQDSKFVVIKEARRLCMSYCIFAATMPDMFGLEPTERNPLTPHLLIEDPEDERSIDHDFLTEAISQFPEDDNVRAALVGAVEDLSHELARMNMNDNYKPYVMALRNLVQYPQMIYAIVQSPLFLPPSIPASIVEASTLLGPFFAISPLNDEVSNNYFSSPTTRDKSYVLNSQRALRLTLQTHETDLLDIVNHIIKAGKDSRDKMLDWFALCVNVNHKRRALQVDKKTVSSDGFMINLTVCLDQLCEPFMDATFSKVDRIDVDYLRRSPRVDIKEETKLNADQKTSDAFYSDPAQGTSNFISEIFFLTLAAHHYGTESANAMLSQLEKDLKRMKKHIDEIELDRHKFVSDPYRLRTFEQAIKKYKDEVDIGMSYKYSVEGVLLDDLTQARSMHFMRYVIVWLLRLVTRGQDFPKLPIKLPLPEEQPEVFKCLPEYFLEDIVSNFKFIMRNMPQIITSTQSDELVILCITFLRSSEYIKNPYLKSGLVTIMFHGIWPIYNRTKGILGDLLNSLPFATEHLLHALMKFYIEVENTGTHTQFFDKFNIRYEIFQIIKCIWSNSIYREHLSTEAKINLDFFVRFVNLLLNDVTFVLDESLTAFVQIHNLQQELKYAGPTMEQNVKTEKEEALSAAQGRAKSYMQLTNETVAMLKLFTEALADSFTKPEIVQRLADMLDYNLDAMVGTKSKDLVVENPAEYGFSPKQLLAEIVDVYLNLKDKENFVFAVARDGRSYKPANLEQATRVLKKWALKSSEELAAWASLGKKFKKAKELDDQAEEDMGEIPDEFLDPLMYTLMEDPVILPTSKTTIDRSTIRSHLLSDPNDPFNRAPLKIEEVIADTDLYEKIQAFKNEKKGNKLADTNPYLAPVHPLNKEFDHLAHKAPPPAADNFAQRQSITTAIRQICLYYPPNTCLRELLQNADDAGASEVEYVLDTTSYAGKPLLSDGLEDFQGPALLVRNNSVFRDEDFKSLSSISDSVKRKDPAATGKFGQGFNAVYHWTDGPWVWSRNWLLILDPHEWWSQHTGQAGGPRWDVVQNREYVEVQNHLKTFSKPGLDPREPLNETVIRIPLRSEAQAAKSKIFQLKVDVSAIRQALEEFGQELKDGGMLFLKHVRKVVVRIDDDELLKAETYGTNEKHTRAKEQLPASFKSLYVSRSTTAEDICPVFELTMKYTEKKTSKSRRYAVQHVMLSSSGDVKIDVWARNEKLFPWAAVAALLEDQNDTEEVHGRLFTILRLPMPTNLPVHIHGLFCMAPDRGRLEPTRGPDDPHTKWNSFMFASCVALAWIKLLAHRSTVSWEKETFAFWPRPNFVPVEIVHLWDQLDDNVIDLAIDSKRKIWNASNGRCVSLDQGFFGIKDGAYAKYGSVLAQVNVPAVYLEEPLFRKLRERAKLLGKVYKLLEPRTVRCFLRQKSIPAQVQASVILEFCLLDAIETESDKKARNAVYKELQDIPLWPTLGGALSISNRKNLLLPPNKAEMHLFAKSRAVSTVNISDLSPPVLQLLLKDIKNIATVMRFRSLNDLVVDWPIMHPTLQKLSSSSAESIRRPSDLDVPLGNIWAWIVERFQRGQRIAPTTSKVLWLVPTNDGRIRLYTPGPESLPVLIIVQKDPLYEFVMSATAKMPAEAPPVLCSSILPAEAVGLFRSNRELRVTTNCTCVDETDGFVDWLVAGINMLSAASDEDKEVLLSHLENNTRYSALSGSLPPTLTTLMRRLPLYSRRSCSPPFKAVGYAKCSLDAREQIYEAPPGLPPLPDMSNVSLFEPQSQAEISIVKRLKALPDVSNEDLLTQHFLPWMGTVTSCDADLSHAKEELVDWIMKIAPTNPRSAVWQTDIFGYAIIPLPIEGGQKRYRCLAGMVDPSSGLAPLYDAAESIFPCPQFFAKHKDVLLAYGLVSEPKWDTPLERARYFAQRGDKVDITTKVETLLKLRVLPKLSNSEASLTEIRKLKWIPSTSVMGKCVLLAPSECRGEDDRDLIDLVWGITSLPMEPTWKKALGWDKSIPTELLLRQLDGCLSKEDHDKAHKVLLEIDPAECSNLSSRRCILGLSGAYFTPNKVFLSRSLLAKWPLAPHLDEVDGKFERQHHALLTALHVPLEPSIQDLQDVQQALASASKGHLGPSDLLIAISTLEIASKLKYDLTGFLVPDTTSTLREMADIVHGNSPNAGMKGDLNFTHPEISAHLAADLGLEDSLARAIRLQIDLDSDNEEDFEPRERLTTVISDTLGRYSIASTFNEFLANADDAKATRIVWTLDECNDGCHASTALLTTDLKPLQGAALFVHNDGVFSKKDFAGFKDIGQGGKHGDTNSTGMFGRGSQSMYHFTDVPMLISARSFLVIDPQQTVHPVDKYRKRKVGTKLSFPTVRSLAFDQLSPFNDLHGFDSTTDYFKGTIFRFPLRAYGVKTDLLDNKERVDLVKVRSLLEDYFATARTALLFLRHVESIEFHIRGQQAPEWSVFAKRRPCEDNDTFQCIEITSGRIGFKRHVDTWCIGLKGIKDIPANITRTGSSSGKSPECGVAALLIQGKVSKVEDGEGVSLSLKPKNPAIMRARQPIVRQTVFCRLPTSHESSLPISFHASFAVTGDRRTIALEKGAENAGWNEWLLKASLSDLYVETLRYLAPRLGPKVFDFWPTGGTFLSSATLSGVLERAFWDKLADQGHDLGDLLPLVAQENTPSRKDSAAVFRPSQKTTGLIGATFDFLPKQTSEGLRIFLIQLIPDLVRPPKELWLEFESMSGHQVRQVNLECLSKIFKVEDNCKLLEAILAKIKDEEGKRTAMALLLETVIPQSAVADATVLSALSGCRIIPRPHFDCPLATLILDPQPDTSWNLLPTPEEQDLFAFAIDIMVNNKLWAVTNISALGGTKVCNPIDILLNANFNIRRCEIGDLGSLLALPRSPTNSANLDDDLAPWLLRFWEYLNTKSLTIFEGKEYVGTPFGMTVAEFLSKANLQDQKIYRHFSHSNWHYITPRQFESEPCIVRPSDEEHRTICDQVHGLVAVDRDCIPFRLRDYEHSLRDFASFKRFLEALGKLEKATKTSAKTIVGECLTQESKDVLRKLALNYLSPADRVQGSTDAILRRLPIWPRRERSDSSPYEHIAAEDAIFCSHEEMVMPWISNLCSFVEPHLIQSDGDKLSKLGVPLLTRENVWQLIKGDIPKYVNTKDSRQRYLKFLQYIAHWGHLEQWQGKISGRIAPNGNSLMCETFTLYDHQDEMFSAAFREQGKTRFLHVDMQGRELRSFWLSLGLRVRSAAGFMSHEHFLDCARAISARWDQVSPDSVLHNDSEVVSAYLGRNGSASMTFQSWPKSTWSQIIAIPMFRVWDVPADEGAYRQDRIRRLREERMYRSLSDASKLDHVRIMWSQACFLNDPPGEFVYNSLPRGGRPTAAQVFEHLTFLMAIVNEISQQDLPEYLRDVQACYEYLQGDVDATKSMNGILQARIWLNLDTTQVDLVLKGYFESSLTSAEKLCLNARFDPFPLTVAKNFLVPYGKLLVGLGCQTVVQPTSAASPPSSDSRELSLISAIGQMRTLRDQGLLVDITFEAGGQRKSAHKIVLAAVSEYCKIQFTGLWGPLLEDQATIHLEGLSFLALSQMVDFAYTGDVAWPELTDSSDNQEVEARLTELLDLLDATNRWLLPRLHGMTENILACQPYNQIYVRVDTVYVVKERAENARALRLVEYCENFLAENHIFASTLRDGEQPDEEVD